MQHHAAMLDVDRQGLLARVQTVMRADHPRLTEQQISLLSEVAVEIRLVRERLGVDAG